MTTSRRFDVALVVVYVATLALAACSRIHLGPSLPSTAQVRVLAGDGQACRLGATVPVTVATEPGETLLVAYPGRGAGNFTVTADSSGLVTFRLAPFAVGTWPVEVQPWLPLPGPVATLTITGVR